MHLFHFVELNESSVPGDVTLTSFNAVMYLRTTGGLTGQSQALAEVTWSCITMKVQAAPTTDQYSPLLLEPLTDRHV